MIDPETLKAAIIEIRQEYAASGISGYDIGNGHCEDFAHTVLERVIGADWMMREGDGFETVDTAHLLDPETGDWDWPLCARRWGSSPPPNMPTEILTRVAAIGPTHIWIAANSLHYDAEHPEGVPHFLDLKFFRRWISTIQKSGAIT